jgi:hypothetical protein
MARCSNPKCRKRMDVMKYINILRELCDDCIRAEDKRK